MQASSFVLGELARLGATQFSSLLDSSEKVTSLLNRNAVKLMMVPLDAAVQAFSEFSRVPSEKWTTTPIGQEIIENHLSTALNFRSPATTSVPALNGNPLPLDAASVQQYQITEHIIIGDIYIYFTRVVLVNPEQLARWNSLADVAPLNPQSPLFSQTPFNAANFDAIVTNGQIRGNDLIALCNTSKEANRLCNRTFPNGTTIFHRFLGEEFGVELEEGQDAREQYILHHNSFYTRYGNVNAGELETRRVSDTRHVQSCKIQSYIFCLDLAGRVSCYHENYDFWGGEDPFTYEMEIGISLTNNWGPLEPLPLVKRMIIGLDQLVLDGINDKQYYLKVEEKKDGARSRSRPVFKPVMAKYRILDYDYVTALIQYPDGKKYTTGTLYAHTDRFGTGENEEVPSDTVSLISHGRVFVRKGSHENSPCILQRNSRAGTSVDLSTFPGGSFRCSKRKLFFYASLQKNMVLVLNDLAELWIRILPSPENLWHKLSLPENSKVVDVDPNNMEAQYAVAQIIVLDDQGRIYNLTIQNDNGEFSPTFALLKTIPGLLKIPIFYLNDLGGIGSAKALQMKF